MCFYLKNGLGPTFCGALDIGLLDDALSRLCPTRLVRVSLRHVERQSQASLQLRGRVHSPTRETRLCRRQDPARPHRPLRQLQWTPIQDESTLFRFTEWHWDQVPAPQWDTRVSAHLGRVRRWRFCDVERVRCLAENSGLHIWCR